MACIATSTATTAQISHVRGAQRGCRAFAPARPAAATACRRRQPLRVAAAAAGPANTDKYPAWQDIQRELVGAGLASLSPEEAYDEVELGRAVLIDVRPAVDHEKAHPRGAVSVPAFVVIDKPSSPGELAKWLACKANGVTPTKNNPQLTALIAEAAAAGKAVILACEAGGTLEPSVSFAVGKESRSLKAAWRVVASQALPAERVKHLAGGVFRWAGAGLPMVGDYDSSNAGRTPNAAGQPTGRYIDSSE